MCLDNNPEEVKKFQKKHKNHKTVTVYKRLNTTGYEDDGIASVILKKGLFPPYKSKYEYKPGINKSNSERRTVSRKSEAIFKGIHVYLKKQNAINSVCDEEIVVKFTAQVRDLLGVEKSPNWYETELTAVFKKVHLSEAEYERAMKQ